MVRCLMRLVAATALLWLAAAAPAHALQLKRCPAQAGFGCATLQVPLDHAGATPGTIGLRIAAQDRPSDRRKPGVLVALTGGPGQGGVDFANAFTRSLKPLLAGRRLVTLDQRGTGGSGALVCPRLQRLRMLAPVDPALVAECAALLGPRRAFYATRDTVEDLESLRVALGVDKIALQGTSYGTFVAQQYARVHPEHVELLVLDSVVPADAGDPFLLDSYTRTARVLGSLCGGDACRVATPDPAADVGNVLGRLEAGELRGTALDATGHARPVAYNAPDELAFAVLAGDLNPFLDALLPGSMHAAATGDRAALLRLRRIADGRRITSRELSLALNVTTTCADQPLPYALSTPFEQRPALVEAALDAVDPATYAPWDRRTVRVTGPADDCLLWPPDAFATPSTAPLPDVPALLLSGELDMRTPEENAAEVAKELPHAQRVVVAGSGHDVTDNDRTGCVRQALRRFASGQPVGLPCAGKTNSLGVFPAPPRSLDAFRSAPGVGGIRGRALFAALDTVADADVNGLARLLSGLPPRGGGLRSGSFDGRGSSLVVRHYSYIPELVVDGRLKFRGAGVYSGRLRVRGPRGTSGTLTVSPRGTVTGRLGGRAVRYRPPRPGAPSRTGSTAAARASRGALLWDRVRALPDGVREAAARQRVRVRVLRPGA